ncbi:unnamed protein product [Parascedosporium putredinis]|uniref:Protein-serine/threonine kinase n=1 Tax=Parascedosporium putredinis TaxID=1442378 RepID=A0A9P1MD22_9PEZI|nr:unnamed protein product [Parascedosporium putredinis]CAI7998825.1 unnamed protein product [Parascedosporium putredinis]
MFHRLSAPIARRRISSTPRSGFIFGTRSPPTPRPVTDHEIAALARHELHPLSLADLISHGRPPLSESALLSSANFTLSLIPVRLASRIQALRNLPYIVVSNPNINKIYNNYVHSLSTLLPWYANHSAHTPAIQTLEDEVAFTSALAELDVTRFLDEHLRVRIGTRLIAEQHIALHYSSQAHGGKGHGGPQYIERPSYVGAIDTALRPATTVELCADWVADICELRYGIRPKVVINGEPDTTFAFVPMHLEYIVTELLKNAFRATLENRMASEPIDPASPTPEYSLGEHDDPPEADLLPTSATTPAGAGASPASSSPTTSSPRRKRLGSHHPHPRSRRRHIPSLLDKIWSYSFTTFSADDELPGSSGNSDGLAALSSAGPGASSLAGLGYGLPLSRAYAEYFGGGIALQSLYGWGTDVYLRLKGVGKIAS